MTAVEIHVRQAARSRFGPWVVAMACLGLVLDGLAPLTPRAEAQLGGPDGSVLVEGNLFHPSRSAPAPPLPPQSALTAASPAPPPPPKFVLSGVVIHGSAAMALLQEPGLTQNKVVVVEKGQPVGSYQLTDVQFDRVTLQSPTGALTVLLFDPNKPKPAAPRAAVAPAATTETSTPLQSAPTLAIPAARPAKGGKGGEEDLSGGKGSGHGGGSARHGASDASGQAVGRTHGGSATHGSGTGGTTTHGGGPAAPAPGPMPPSAPKGGDTFRQSLEQAIQQFRSQP